MRPIPPTPSALRWVGARAGPSHSGPAFGALSSYSFRSLPPRELTRPTAQWRIAHHAYAPGVGTLSRNDAFELDLSKYVELCS